MHIKSDSPIVQQQLEFIANLVIENGGLIHPELCITHQTERLWISCSADVDSSALLIIPDELFIPVTHLEWTGENGVLSYSGDTSSLSAVQQALLDAMLSLYNATGKMQHVAERFPTQLLQADAELFAWLMDARPEFELPTKNPARQFITTRLNEHSEHAQKVEGSDEEQKPIGYLMPLIDLLNHHPYGPKYQRTEQNGWLIALQKPNPGSDECFVRYNKADSLNNALWHTYCETNTRCIASVSCLLQHPELGSVQIKDTNASRNKVNAPRLLPNEPILTLQDLVLEQEMLPALRTLLGLAVRSKIRDLSQAQAESVADELIVLLVEANKMKYAELLGLCQKDTELFPLRTLFGQVASHQLELLGRF